MHKGDIFPSITVFAVNPEILLIGCEKGFLERVTPNIKVYEVKNDVTLNRISIFRGLRDRPTPLKVRSIILLINQRGQR